MCKPRCHSSAFTAMPLRTLPTVAAPPLEQQNRNEPTPLSKFKNEPPKRQEKVRTRNAVQRMRWENGKAGVPTPSGVVVSRCGSGTPFGLGRSEWGSLGRQCSGEQVSTEVAPMSAACLWVCACVLLRHEAWTGDPGRRATAPRACTPAPVGAFGSALGGCGAFFAHRTAPFRPQTRPFLGYPHLKCQQPSGGDACTVAGAPVPRGQGCIRRGWGGGGMAGTPLLPESPYGPRRRQAQNFKLKSSWHRRCRIKILAVSLKHWKGRRVGGSRGGGGMRPLYYITARGVGTRLDERGVELRGAP